jgi:hypothetical protein
MGGWEMTAYMTDNAWIWKKCGLEWWVTSSGYNKARCGLSGILKFSFDWQNHVFNKTPAPRGFLIGVLEGNEHW